MNNETKETYTNEFGEILYVISDSEWAEQRERIKNYSKKSVIDNWLKRDFITLDQAVRLSMDENPDEPTDFDTQLMLADEYKRIFKEDKPVKLKFDIRYDEATQWILSDKLKAEAILTDEGSSEYQDIQPSSFFKLAKSNHWHLPKEILDILRQWELIIGSGEVQPLEPLTDEDLQYFRKCRYWNWIDAIYILEGYKPVQQLDIEEVREHFPEQLSIFTQGLQIGDIGKKITEAGKNKFIDSPAKWEAFWQSIYEPKSELQANGAGAIGKTKRKANADRRREIAVNWYAKIGKPDMQPHTNKDILELLIAFSGQADKALWNSGGLDWVERNGNRIWGRKSAGKKPKNKV